MLEHLLDPLAVLKGFLEKLVPRGQVFVSLPNVACFYVRLGLLLGRFNPAPEGGVLDESHLHFYTLATARELLWRAACGSRSSLACRRPRSGFTRPL